MNRGGADITLQDALDATNSFILRDLERSNMEDGPAGTVAPVHLPIQLFNDRPHKPQRVKHTFDVVGEIDFGYELKDQVPKCFREDRGRDLPEPIGFKTVPKINVKLQMAVIPTQTPVKFYLLKHFVSEQLVKSTFMKGLCFGSVHTLTWARGGRTKNLRKALHYMFAKMGGFQVVCYSLQAAALTSSDKAAFYHHLSEEDIDAGFDFIERDGPRTRHSNQQLRWIVKQLSQAAIPIPKLPERLITETLRNLMNDDGVRATMHSPGKSDVPSTRTATRTKTFGSAQVTCCRICLLPSSFCT